MTTEDALLAAVLAAPDDDVVRKGEKTDIPVNELRAANV